MTNIKKTGKDKGGTKGKKLQFRKETVSDLTLKDKAAVLKGGKAAACKCGDTSTGCDWQQTN